MKYMDEYRDEASSRKYSELLHKITTKNWNIMEICGGQTHSIMKFGIDQLLPSHIQIIHGPGCPVCVTPLEMIDKAIHIASQENVIFTSFGDMLRVPGSEKDLFSVKASSGDVRIVYSPLDAVQIAKDNPQKEVVFFAIGFETTIPGNAMAVLQAKKNNIKNFSVLVSQVRVPPAMETILSAEDNIIDGFLSAGHVNTIMGYHEYIPIASRYKTPIVVTGFEPVDILRAFYELVKLLENNDFTVKNAYERVVTKDGNMPAQKMIYEIFKIGDQKWRGIGKIPESGFILNDGYEDFNANLRFDTEMIQTEEPESCIAGEILKGNKKPYECPAFGDPCTPENPLGATMVSSEGACAAYYKYRRTSYES